MPSIADRLFKPPMVGNIPYPDLSHLPGTDGLPIVGTTLEHLRDPLGLVTRLQARHGPVFRLRSFGSRAVVLLGADANEMILLDRERNFSSTLGWEPLLGHAFSRGLMLLDFDEHRMHRRVMNEAFKASAMQSYLGTLNRLTASALSQWPRGRFAFYPQIKELTLNLAAAVFLGLPFGAETQEINAAFVDTVRAIAGIVRAPLPGTLMAKGLAGRARLEAFFKAEIPRRRQNPGTDMLSLICRADPDDGFTLSDRDIINHMIFLMMAAHDTTTSALTALVQQLAENPVWQGRLREKIKSTGGPEGISYDDLGKLVVMENAFKEAMRLHPPVPSILRRSLRDFSWQGHVIPAGAGIAIMPSHTHFMPEYWDEPLRFDPDRFLPAAVAKRHKYAWFPFSGGAHMCLGLHFAYMMAKVVLFHLLQSEEILPATPGSVDWINLPIPKPRNRLPIRLRALV